MHSTSHPFRVCFVSTMNGVPWGGSEQLWSETALRLRAQGHEISASVFRWPARPAQLDELARAGAQLAFRPLRPRLVDRVLRLCARHVSPLRDFLPIQWLRRQAPDLVVISQGGPWDGVPWTALCRRLGLPYCTIVHANSELWWPLDSHLPDIVNGLEGAEHVFFVSRANRRLMELQCGRSLPRASIVANPCNVDRRSAVPWPGTELPVRLACVGRLSPNAKGQDVLFELLAREKWRARPLQLHVYGSGPAENSIRSLAAYLGLSNVIFHGQVSDIRALWAANHALVLPSRFEGLPLTIIEAMLCGRPVITTDVAGNTEVVTDELTGFVAAGPTVPLLDDALERAWCRRSEWRDIGLRARAAALDATPADAIGDFAETLLGLAGAARIRRNPVLPPPAAVLPDVLARPRNLPLR